MLKYFDSVCTQICRLCDSYSAEPTHPVLVDYDIQCVFSFDFYLSAAGVDSATFHMPIFIKRVNVAFFLTAFVLDKGVQEVLITSDYINVSANDVVLHNDRIQFLLQTEPKHLQLFYKLVSLG